MWTGRRIALVVFGALLVLTSPITIMNLFENLDASHVMVIQSPVSGELAVYTDPGVKWQGFGKVTVYPRRATYTFGVVDKVDNSKKLRFNDGGHGNLYGASQWEMPLDAPSVVAIHKAFGSAEGVESGAVARMIDAAVYLAGPLMSSTESTGERRADLVQYINDQAAHGVYVTRVKTVDTVDPVTGNRKEVLTTEIVVDKDGTPRRQQGSILQDFKIRLLPLSITELKYDPVVEDQIKQRQQATTQVQIAQARARQAEQQALTAEADGKAAAASAKWKQETVKAQVITEAQQNLEKATLAAKEAEQYKREQILRGEGDAQRKQLVMNADGALDAKLEAYVNVNKNYAEAIQNAAPGAWTPTVVMGPGSQGGASTLVDLFTAKTARELGIDMTVGGKAATAKK